MRYVTLLRGINVGGNNKVPMADLKQAFKDMGFTNVSTYINSGNVLFSSKHTPDQQKIDNTLSQTFGFPIRTVTRTQKNIKKVVEAIPTTWQNNAEQKTDVLFLWDDYDNKSSLGLIQATSVDTLRYIDGAIVWHIKKKDYSKSGMNKFIGTTLYKNMTARNINTVRKLGELVR